MACKEYEPLIQRYLDGDISCEERSAVEKHVKECESCRQELTEHEKIAKMLSTLDVLPAPKNFLQNVRVKLEVSQSIWQKVATFFGRPMQLRHSFGVIAIIVVFLGFFIWANWRSGTNLVSEAPAPEKTVRSTEIAMNDEKPGFSDTESRYMRSEYPSSTGGYSGLRHDDKNGVVELSDKSAASTTAYQGRKIAGEGKVTESTGSASKPDMSEINKESIPSKVADIKVKRDVASQKEPVTSEIMEGDGDGKVVTTSTLDRETEQTNDEPAGTVGKVREKTYDDSLSPKLGAKMAGSAKTEEKEMSKAAGHTLLGKGPAVETGVELEDAGGTGNKDKEEHGEMLSYDYYKNALKIVVPIKNYNEDIKALNAIIQKENASVISSLKKELPENKDTTEITALVLKVGNDNLDSLQKKLAEYNREKPKMSKSVKTAITTLQKVITVIITVEKAEK